MSNASAAGKAHGRVGRRAGSAAGLRNGTRRIISVRHAHANEERTYFPEWTDPDDAPMLTEAILKDAEYFDEDRFIRRGPRRPRLDAPKEQINIRLDAEVLSLLRRSGPGWQPKINDMLRVSLGLK